HDDVDRSISMVSRVVAHTAAVIHCSSFCFGAAPTCRDAIWPFLKIINVGIDMMPYLAAVCGFSSTLSLRILTLSPREPAISSSAGAIIRHGPHHSAQKSTTTGLVDFNTSDSKVASETFSTVMGDTSFSLCPGLAEWDGPNDGPGTYGAQSAASSALTQ